MIMISHPKWLPITMKQTLDGALREILQKIETGGAEYSYDFDKILEIIGADLLKINIASLLTVYDNTRENLIFKKLTLPFNIPDIPELPPFPIKDFFTYDKIITTKRAIFLKNRLSLIKKTYPLLINFLDNHIPPPGETNSIISPIIIKGEIIGFLELLSPELKNRHVEIVENFTKELAHEIAHSILFTEIKRSEARYRDLFENSREGFFIFNGRKKRYIEVNHGFMEMTGYTKEELRQNNFLIPFDVEERLRINTYIKNRLEGLHGTENAPAEYETKILTKKGETKHVLLRITRIINNDEWFVIVIDKTEKKLAEKILKENEEMYRKLVESAGSIILRRKIDGTITFINKYAEKFFGWTKDEIVGKNVVGTIVPQIESTGRNLEEMIKQISQDPENFSNNQNENIKKDGTVVWIAWNNKGIYDENGQLVGVLAVGIDMTEKKKSETALGESEEKFRALTENSPDTIMRFDKELRHVYVNPKVYDETGIPPQNYIGKTHSELGFPENLVKIWEEALNRTFRTGKITRIEFKLPKGAWIDWLLFPEFSDSGEVQYVITSARDITERKKSEIALSESEEKFRALAENLPDVVMRFDKNFNHVYVNKKAQELTGFTLKDFLERGESTMGFPDDLVKIWMDALTKTFTTKKITRAEFKLPNDIWIDWLLFPEFSKDDEVQYIISSGRDITERKKIENALIKSEEKYRQLSEFNQRILDNAPVSIMVLNKNGTIVSVNGLAQKWMGKSSTEAINRPILETNTMKNNSELQRRYKQLLENGKPVFLNNVLYKPANKDDNIYLNFIAIPLFDEDGKLDGAISMAFDNTEAMEAKLGLEQLNRELEQKIEERTQQLHNTNLQLNRALELKLKFIADASHELRTPMTILQGNLDLLRKEVKDCSQEASETIGLINKEVEHMVNILADLTMLATADTAVETIFFEPVDLGLLVEAVSRSLKILADQKNITIKTKPINSPMEIMGDEDRLEKVLTNLVRNAIRYNKPGGWIEINIEEKNNGIEMLVSDSGIGIPEKDLPFVFERFYRVDKARSRADGGSGLGLAICKSIVDLHNGHISVTSTLNKGTTFKVWLPFDYKNI